jgi:phage-related minor tail protein
MADGNKNRKYGRNLNSAQNKRYKAENRQARNKEARRQRTAKRQPNNVQLTLNTEKREAFDTRNALSNAERKTANKAKWAEGFTTSLKLVDGNFHRAVDRLPGKLDVRQLWTAHKTK